MPESMGVKPSSNYGNDRSATQKRRPKQDGSPRSSPRQSKRSDVSVKQDLTRIFAEEWKEFYGTSYLPSAEDGKTLHYNVVPLVDTNGGYNKFLEEWRSAIREALRINMMWGEGDTDEAGRPTILGFVNNYNDVRLLSSEDDGARMFRSAYNKYRQVWGVDKLAAYRSAAKIVHAAGYRLSSIDPRLLKTLKTRYSNRDLGLDNCPEEDRLRFSDEEICAEIDGNPTLFIQLMRLSKGTSGPLRKRVIDTYKEAQRRGVVFDAE